MGNRGNIVILQKDNKELYFYTHWHGGDIKKILKSALIRGKSRWDDDSYLARIIFSELVKDNIEDTVGYGISTYITDNEHKLLVVDVDNNKVWLADKGSPRSPIENTTKTFEDFIG